MENSITPSEDIKTGALTRINGILNMLSEIRITSPGQLGRRYDLLNALFNDVAIFMDEDDIKETQQALNILYGELDKYRNKRNSQFISMADEFERDVRRFCHIKIKIGGQTW